MKEFQILLHCDILARSLLPMGQMICEFYPSIFSCSTTIQLENSYNSNCIDVVR